MNIILPTLRAERRKTYCPFLPICPDTGHVLEIPVKKIEKNNFETNSFNKLIKLYDKVAVINDTI